MFTTNVQIILVNLHCKSYHLLHTKYNITLSLAGSIVHILADNKSNRLQELKDHLLKRKHPENMIDFTK